MKELKNKTTKIELRENGKSVGKLTYGWILDYLCNSMPQGGVTMRDIEIRIAIRKATKASNGKIKLEQDWVEYLKPIVVAAKYPVSHEDILTFIKDIQEL